MSDIWEELSPPERETLSAFEAGGRGRYHRLRSRASLIPGSPRRAVCAASTVDCPGAAL